MFKKKYFICEVVWMKIIIELLNGNCYVIYVDLELWDDLLREDFG